MGKTIQQMLGEAIAPHAQALAEIAADGDVAVLVERPSPLGKKAAKELGWTGDKFAPVFRLEKRNYGRLAASDAVTRRWLAREGGDGRVFIIIEDGTFLLNVGDRGLYLEPGSLDDELKATRN